MRGAAPAGRALARLDWARDVIAGDALVLLLAREETLRFRPRPAEAETAQWCGLLLAAYRRQLWRLGPVWPAEGVTRP
jgi:hypothetical protein